MKLCAALLTVVVASGCGQRAETYGVLHDAGLSADGKTLLVLVEHGTQTTQSGNMWRGDITTKHPESMKIHEFDRASGTPGRVLDYPPPPVSGPRPFERVGVYAARSGMKVSSLPECRELYTECAATTTPHPYMLNRRVADPQGGRMIQWDGRRLVVTPFEAMTAAQIRAARDALFRRSVERMHAAATKDLGERPASEDPERIDTGERGTAEGEPGMTATYSLMPGRVIQGRFEYADNRFKVGWERDGACVADNADAARAVGCDAGDEGALQRVSRGIARARPPDPDRTGTTWGVIATWESEAPKGTVTVACHGTPRETAGKPCEDQKGDTACRATLPMLCSKADATLPARSPLARQLALTAPVRGTDLVSISAADQVCRTELGDGWKMTESEESTFKYQITGIGSLPGTTRFWVRNGGGLANCW
ncbi:MAG: hypothetical protein ABI569_01500 [Casimicrobiaceae bacterium]